MSDTVIRVENLYKEYRLGVLGHGTLTRDLQSWWARVRGKEDPNAKIGQDYKSNGGKFLALEDVSFEVKQGEVLGIIGRNGAGKSTLLKILSRVTAPTKGTVKIKGRIASLLEVGTGFHPELTGRENIYLNGAILGMTKKEIDKKFDEIVDFAEIEKFIDTPVKRYSSGMYVRLAFAVAAHLEPEILLIDEVLAVGDASFQKKCLGKMGEVAQGGQGGRTVLFVSHNMAAVQNLCAFAYLLNQGRIIASGNVIDVVSQYLETVSESKCTSISSETPRQGNGKLIFTDFICKGITQANNVVTCGEPTSFIIKYQGTSHLRNVHISVGLFTPLGERVLYLSNDLVGKRFDNLRMTGAFVCRFEKLPLLPGTYIVNLYCTVNGILADWVIDAAQIHVVEGDYFGSGKLPPKGYGALVADHDWDVIES